MTQDWSLDGKGGLPSAPAPETGVVLVTGGAGFIGSHVVDTLVESGFRVRVIDSLHPLAHRGPPDYLNPGADYAFADLRDAESLDRCLDGVTAVSHQASMVGMGTDFSDVTDYAGNNDLATAELLRALYKRRFTGRMVLGSSMVIYGEGRYRCPTHGVVRPLPRNPADLAGGRFDARCPRCGERLSPEPIPEEAPPDPQSVYAATKLHQEHLCFAFGRATGASVAALRYHNVYGPRMPADTPYAGVASIFRSALAAGRPPQVFEDGYQLRDFVHVRDVARANLLALTADVLLGGAVFNIASGQPHTVGEMAAALTAANGGGLVPEVTGQYRIGDVRHIFASTEQAERHLGFRSRVPFLDGMKEFVKTPLRSGLKD